MEINAALVQGLAQAIAGGGEQLPQPSLPPPLQTTEPLPGKEEPSLEWSMAPEQAAETVQLNQAGDGAGILTSGEKEVLDIFFNGREESNFALYGPQPSKPATLGNFLDVRG